MGGILFNDSNSGDPTVWGQIVYGCYANGMIQNSLVEH